MTPLRSITKLKKNYIWVISELFFDFMTIANAYLWSNLNYSILYDFALQFLKECMEQVGAARWINILCISRSQPRQLFRPAPQPGFAYDNQPLVFHLVYLHNRLKCKVQRHVKCGRAPSLRRSRKAGGGQARQGHATHHMGMSACGSSGCTCQRTWGLF